MVKLGAFFNLIRWKNLAIIAIIGLCYRYFILAPIISRSFPDISVSPVFSLFNFVLLLISVISIAASGYVINDICDVATDKINKPHKVFIDRHFSRKQGNNLHHALNIIGIGIGVYLSILMGNYSYAVIFILPAVLLRLYAIRFSRMLILGNVIISLLAGLLLIALTFFDILAYHQKWFDVLYTLKQVQFNSSPTQLLINWMLGLAIFSTWTTLIREIIKDIQDVEGDRFVGAKTLPIVLGIPKTKWIVYILSIALIGFIAYLINSYLIPSNGFHYSFQYGSFIIALLIGLVYQTHQAESKENYQFISNLMKIIMLSGIAYSIINYSFYTSIFL